MKTFKPLLLLFAVLAFLSATPRASARVSFDFFYNNLEPYGEWVEVADYGYCWHPTGVDQDWAPYTDGYWAYTDSGWTWVSYEDFGGITYHYGRWVRLEDEGWCWVPDYEWAPAWVSWRSSDDFVGWAPLPPRARFHHDTGFSVSVDTDYDIGPSYYNFCEYRHFGDPALRGVIVDRSRNVTIINRTTNITNITVNRTTNNVFVGGPQYQTVNQRVSRPIQVLRLRRETDDASIRGAGSRTLARQQGNQLVVLAPEVAQADPKFKPSKVARNIATPKVDRGWNGVKDPQAREQLEAKFKGEAKGREHAVARPVQAQDLQIVDEKVKGQPQPAAVPANPTAAPLTAPVAGASPGRGKNKKGQPLTNEVIAQPSVAPAVVPQAVAKRRKGQPRILATPKAVVTTPPDAVVPAATPFAKEKNKHPKVPADVSTQPAAPIVPALKKEKHGPPQGETQPFLTEPVAPVKQPKREITAPVLNPDIRPLAPIKPEKKEKHEAPKIDAPRREPVVPMQAPVQRVKEIQRPVGPGQPLAPAAQAQKKGGKEKGRDEKKKKDEDNQ